MYKRFGFQILYKKRITYTHNGVLTNERDPTVVKFALPPEHQIKIFNSKAIRYKQYLKTLFWFYESY